LFSVYILLVRRIFNRPTTSVVRYLKVVSRYSMLLRYRKNGDTGTVQPVHETSAKMY